jgi:hypothetical protein
MYALKVNLYDKQKIVYHFISTKDSVDTFTVEKLHKQLEDLNVKFIDIAIAQFYKETGYKKGTCSELLDKANNLFGLKNAIVRPTSSSGIYRIGKQKYAYYCTWRQSALDYALYQSHYINKNTTKEDWIRFINSNYSTDKNYNIQKVKIK